MFTFLLIVFAFILVCSLIVRLIVWRFMSKSKNAQYPQQQKDHRRGNDGDVYVSKDDTDDDKKVVEKDMGEYVDYEPVKEENKDGNL